MSEEALAAAKSAALARLAALAPQGAQEVSGLASAKTRPQEPGSIRIAVQGCAHGELDAIYATVAEAERAQGRKIDLLLCCGDFQAVRFPSDLECMAVPPKFRVLGTFYRYYTGEKVAPVPTIFIGGNHEASNYLQELCHGGWAAPNIFFLGYSGVVNFRGLRIGGLSGIYKGHDFSKGHFERPPYDRSTLRSVYHVREYDVWKMQQLDAEAAPLDIFMTHDWPRGITRYGDEAALLRRKSFFRAEVQTNTLGSTPGERLVHILKPRYWFAAHLHVKFPAVVLHSSGDDGVFGPPATGAVDGQARTTKFLALDKCLPGRDFLQVVEIPCPEADRGDGRLRYDPEWLSIVRASLPLFHACQDRWRAPPQSATTLFARLPPPLPFFPRRHVCRCPQAADSCRTSELRRLGAPTLGRRCGAVDTDHLHDDCGPRRRRPWPARVQPTDAGVFGLAC